jgi:hypothetical protein
MMEDIAYSHGSESKFKGGRVPELDTNLKKQEQWSRAVKAAMQAEGTGLMLIGALNKVVSTPDARAIDNEAKDVAHLLKMLCLAAAANQPQPSGVAATGADIETSVKEAKELRTPMKMAGETVEAQEAREDAEAGGNVWQDKMKLLPPTARGYVLGMAWHVDPKTGKMESRAKQEKRMKCWSGLVEPSLQRNHLGMLHSQTLQG